MAISITHTTVAIGTDANSGGQIKKAQWNEAHTITGAVEVFSQSGAAQTIGATTSETVLATISFSGGELGANGHLIVITQWTTNNSANNKNMFVRVGGVAGTQFMSVTNTTQVGLARIVTIANANSASSQKTSTPAGNATGFGQYSASGVTSTVNTASAWDLVISGNKANSGDTLTLESYQVLVCYRA